MMAAHVRDDKRFIRAKAGGLTFVVYGEDEFTLTAPANDEATTLSIKPLRYAPADDSVFYCAQVGIAVKLNGAPSFGAHAITIDAAAAPLVQGLRFRIVLDPTSWSMRWRCQTPELDTDIITAKTTSDDISVVNHASALFKLVQVAFAAADTEEVELGSYHHDLWRTNTGFEEPLASGDFELAET